MLDRVRSEVHNAGMLRILSAVSALPALAVPISANADLPVGTRAPDFATQGALAGRVISFRLRDALRNGPVVLYFYPKAFTQGCTLETRAFAEAHDRFQAMNATVLGLSADDLPTLQRFSTDACGSKFAVGVATAAIVRAYDAALKPQGTGVGTPRPTPTAMASRTSYVIAPDGRITFVHSNMDYRDHVRLTLEAVRALRQPRTVAH